MPMPVCIQNALIFFKVFVWTPAFAGVAAFFQHLVYITDSPENHVQLPISVSNFRIMARRLSRVGQDCSMRSLSWPASLYSRRD